MKNIFWGDFDEFKNFCTKLEINNDDIKKLTGVTNISDIFSKNNNTLSFVKNVKYLDKALNNDNITVIITNISNIEITKKKILVDNPEFIFWSLFEYKQRKFKINQPSHISPLAKIGKNVSISNLNVHIGEDVEIEDNVIINSNCFVDANSKIGSNSVISSSGFVVKNTIFGRIVISHTGWSRIGKNVTIGPLCTINKGLKEDTYVGDNSAIDCGVHVAHNCNIGNNNIIAAHVTFGGSVNTGADVFIGLSAVLINRVSIASHSHIGAGCVVVRSYFEKVKLLGYPAKSVTF